MTYGQIEYFAHRMKGIGSTDKQFLVVLFIRNSYVVLAIVLKRDIYKKNVKKNWIGLGRVVRQKLY